MLLLWKELHAPPRHTPQPFCTPKVRDVTITVQLRGDPADHAYRNPQLLDTPETRLNGSPAENSMVNKGATGPAARHRGAEL